MEAKLRDGGGVIEMSGLYSRKSSLIGKPGTASWQVNQCSSSAHTGIFHL